MNEEVKEMRLKGIDIAFKTNKEVITKSNPYSNNETVTKGNISFNEAIYLRDTLITELAEMGEPVYFDSEYICTSDLLDCHYEVEHDCS